MSKYKAVFMFHGFLKELELTGRPPLKCGFPIPVPTDKKPQKSLSLYFVLI